MKPYTHILFDWDGTLTHSLDVWHAALKSSLEQRGYFFDDIVIGANFAIFKERMQALQVADIDSIISTALAITAQTMSDVALNDNVLQTLQTLHKTDKKVGLVTTSTHAQVDPLIAKYHLGRFFEQVICGDDVTNHKPHPEPIEKALKLFGTKRQHTVIIGDSDSDIMAATNAGIDSILFFPPEHSTFYDLKALQALKPTHTITDFRDIIRLVL